MHFQRVAACLLVTAIIAGTCCAPQADNQRAGQSTPEKFAALPAPAPIPDSFKSRIDAALDHVRQRPVITTFGFWTIFHAILGMGPEQTTLVDPDTNQHFNAVDYICQGKPVRGMVFLPMGNRGLDVQTQPGTGVGQGHQDQFVAEMTQWGMPLTRPFIVGGKDYTFADFVRYSKARTSVTSNQELSWAILIISQHDATDGSWTNESGEKLTFEDVVRYELNQPIEEAACGGTHRLFGLTWAYHLHLQRGGQKTEVWKDVAAKIEHYKSQAHKLQNPDFSFSTGYVSQPGSVPDKQVRIGTTGHVLEWLALALSDEEIKQTWVQEAANALVMMLLESRSDPIESGALYHAVHGLHIYRARVFGTQMPGLLFPPPPK